MKVEDTSGSAASALRIDGRRLAGSNIEGSYAVTLDLDVNDTMDDLILEARG